MAKREELRAISAIKIGDRIIRWEDLSSQERGECVTKMMENCGRAVGEYLNRNRDELAVFVKQPGVEVSSA